ncbi:MAG TPA: YceI family protein [Candidatus Polarisedimenticolaceae bacterium]|nr:YceI family protein [Candidatus Polarisedimenticolaceae bacterium]
MRGKIFAGSLGLLLALSAARAADTFQVDRAHSHVNFEIRHLISTVTGSFRDFSGTIQLDREDMTKSSVDFTIQTASIDTGQEGRDKHLRSEDFFDAEKNPQITFKSKKIIQKSAEYYDVAGDFTMHGVTKEIILPVKFLGLTKGPRGGDLAGFKIDFVLNRKDYGIAWNKDYQAGLMLLGDDVDVHISLETGPPPPPKPAEKPAEKK